jgi:hypothetical protein
VTATATAASTTTTTNEAGDALPQLHGRLHRWAVDQHQFLAGFAAVKFSKDGPGALFVFSNCGLDDLLVADEDPEFSSASRLERQTILVRVGYVDHTGCHRHQRTLLTTRPTAVVTPILGGVGLVTWTIGVSSSTGCALRRTTITE